MFNTLRYSAKVAYIADLYAHGIDSLIINARKPWTPLKHSLFCLLARHCMCKGGVIVAHWSDLLGAEVGCCDPSVITVVAGGRMGPADDDHRVSKIEGS